MRKALFAIILLALVLVPETSFTSATQAEASAPETVFIPHLAIKSNPSPSTILSTTSESEQVSSFGLYRSQQDWLYPQDIDPPESCNVSRIAPLGEDVEHMLAPWDSLNPLVALDQPAAWKADINLTGAEPSSDLAAVALNTEELVATWQNASDGRLYVAEWNTISGWHAVQDLGIVSSGKPAILSRVPEHYAVFARSENTIMLAEYYIDTMGGWQTLPGIEDAASDPQVISLDAGHMALFYQTADGTLKFTEWNGAWLKEPVSLSATVAGSAVQADVPHISIVSRNANHLAVFQVNANGELWFRERMKADEPDWSNTRWIKLMEGVEFVRPAVTSRHDNHMGVLVMDTNGQPNYLWWSFPHLETLYMPVVVNSGTAVSQLGSAPDQEVLAWDPAGLWFYGWHAPVPLGNMNFTSGMTLVPRSLDSLSVLGIADNILYEMTWSEQEGWGNWQAITPATMEANQAVTAVIPKVNDIMLLGRRSAQDQAQAWSKHYSSQDEAVTETQLSGPTSGSPRAQAVVIVEGRTVWVTILRDEDTGTWQAKAQEVSTGIVDTLDLNHADSNQVINRVSVAAADLDVDGSDEVAVATLQLNRTNIDLSLLEISFPTPGTLEIQADHTVWQGIPEGDDVNVAVGDMDIETYQKEIAVGYRGADAMHIGVYQYGEGGLTQPAVTAQRPYYWDEWCTQPGQDGDCSVAAHDMEIAIGGVFDRYQGYQYAADQLVILDLAHMQGKCVLDPAQCAPGFCSMNPTSLQCVDYVQDYVDTLYINSDTWSMDPIESFYNEVYSNTHTTNPHPAAPYTGALGTGDMNADGNQDIVYAFADRVVASRVSYTNTETIHLDGFPNLERSLAVGEIDLDGRAEAGLAYREIGSTAYKLVEMVSDDQVLVSASHTLNGSRMLLVADTDSDTQIAQLAGCKIFGEFSVIAVVNGVPRWYADGQPIQENGGYYGRTDSSGGGEVEDGTTETYGGSLTIGFEHEFNAPITGIKIASVRASVTGEFMYSTISETVSITSTTQEDGYQFGEYSLGMVVYNSTQFICYYYDVYPPAKPENRNRAMVCQPTGRSSFEDFKPLEDWHSASFKQAAGPSWVDVGHRSPQGARTNDLDEQGNYAAKLPVDASAIMYTWDANNPKRISYSSLGGFESYWGISQMEGGEQEDRDSYEWSVTASVGGSWYDFQADVSGTYGQGWEEATMVTWEETLEIGGLVEKFQDDTRECYDVVPYVYIARAVTGAGQVYNYTEMDYYVPWIGPCALDVEEAGSSTPSDVPHPE